MLKLLQERLPDLWTNDHYSDDFNSDPAVYRDFDHALKHVIKAAVKLQNMCEEADHAGRRMVWSKKEIEKYLADLVISTVRASLEAPGFVVDLEKAVRDRVRDKMGVDI